MLIVARLICGFDTGILSVVTPLYISEISPPEIRGSLLVLIKRSKMPGSFPDDLYLQWSLQSSLVN